ncbi:hypothetical protein F0562_008487 [Nyssa sinensis]|uniref:Uncharacterized protein n=1 Tax=Nyssa sinensis TaxID=561372 RepID=A0A5J5A760_9ASTE|nr:hypothetical protein F0562_008487 [Nyssa sinensis]
MRINKAFGLSTGPSLRLPCPPRLHRRRTRLDRRIAVNVHMSVLSVRDHHSGACVRADQGPNSRHGVVHLSDSLLEVAI